MALLMAPDAGEQDRPPPRPDLRTAGDAEQHLQRLALGMMDGISRILCRSALVKNRVFTRMAADSGCSSIRLPLGADQVFPPSRVLRGSDSIGGLVTRKELLQHLKSSCGRSDNTASGVSVPIEEMASRFHHHRVMTRKLQISMV